MRFVELGSVEFEAAWRLQDETVAEIVRGERPETVYLLEHPHVFTLGRGGREENLLASIGWDGDPVPLVRINRGGDITYHGPGQLVGYVHLDLRRRRRDVHRYLRDLERALIETAASFGVSAFRRRGFTGVWTEQGKLASIGVGIRRWITMHGFALNVDPDLRYFELINPCGMARCPVTSFSRLLEEKPSTDEVGAVFRRRFLEVFEGEKPASSPTSREPARPT